MKKIICVFMLVSVLLNADALSIKFMLDNRKINDFPYTVEAAVDGSTAGTLSKDNSEIELKNDDASKVTLLFEFYDKNGQKKQIRSAPQIIDKTVYAFENFADINVERVAFKISISNLEKDGYGAPVKGNAIVAFKIDRSYYAEGKDRNVQSFYVFD
jgi:hypothetical protein